MANNQFSINFTIYIFLFTLLKPLSKSHNLIVLSLEQLSRNSGEMKIQQEIVWSWPFRVFIQVF
jgi:hypothetical protein